MLWIFMIIFSVGVSFIVFPILASINFRKNVRMPAWRIRQQENFQMFIERIIIQENESKSNYKARRLLKMAGYPFKLQVFHYRLLQILVPVIAALFFMLLYLLKTVIHGAIPFPIVPFVMIIAIVTLCPNLILRYLVYKRREELAYEIVKFSHRLVVCVSENIPLYYAVKRAGRTCKKLKPYVDDMLMDWFDDARSAIMKFGDRVGLHEVIPVTNTLLASWNAPQDKIIDLFQHQIRNIDTMRDFQIKKKIEASPLRVTFVILIPFITAAGLVILPWYQNTIDILSKTFR
ncbi:hypothetical protein ACFPOG_12625 [Paenibacillus aestuarii]|uniref:Type II secretion system protein GspF domain-containing protein n=1 Tax=Paenibacillus aestuarii TaxID=516965 RepID=A0ABW0K754_9BACL